MVALLDFEFNQGPTVPKEEIISIGCIILDDNLDEIDSFYSLCRPKVHRKLQYHVKDITKISQNEINEAPSFVKMSNDFIKVIRKYKNITFYSWGLDDENVFLAACKLNRCMWVRKYVPYINDLQKDIFSSLKNGDRLLFRNPKKLAVTSDFYNLEKIKAHNALNDARMLGNIYRAYKQRGTYDFSKNMFENMQYVSTDDLNVAYNISKYLKNEELASLSKRLKDAYGTNFKKILDGNLYHILEPFLDSPLFNTKKKRKYSNYEIEILLDDKEFCLWMSIISKDSIKKQCFDFDTQLKDIITLLRVFSGKKKKHHYRKK